MDADRLNKLREERSAREKARIEKLRQINLQKYSKDETSIKNVPVKLDKPNLKPSHSAPIDKPRNHVSRLFEKPKNSATVEKALSKPANQIQPANQIPRKSIMPSQGIPGKRIMPSQGASEKSIIPSQVVPEKSIMPSQGVPEKSIMPSQGVPEKRIMPSQGASRKSIMPSQGASRKSIMPSQGVPRKSIIPSQGVPRKSMIPTHSLPKKSIIPSQGDTRKSVFERLYQPKVTKNLEQKMSSNIEKPKLNKTNQSTQKLVSKPAKAIPNRDLSKSLNAQLEKLSRPKPLTEVEKIKSNPEFLRKLMKNSEFIVNSRHTVFEQRKHVPTVRRSISAVHLKKINKNELPNCFHKWSSIGDNLDKKHLDELTEEATPMRQDKVVSAVKSERKRVQFKTPVRNLNTPTLDELQDRLKNWLHKRGKSLDSYHHLHCFGIQYQAEKDAPAERTPLQPLVIDYSMKYHDDDEDKENVPLESDSDNESFNDNMNRNTNLDSGIKVDFATQKWRRASYMSESIMDANDSHEITITSEENILHVDDLLLGTLQNLHDIIKEGYDWEQCAQWLRAIRERFPSAPSTAVYWECRAALEESRGNLPGFVECCNEAIANGTETSVVEASLEHLLDKFMQLNISPTKKDVQVNPKMVDVKNVFKSTLIRFAVQQAKLRYSNKQDTPKVLVTPVRRSGRLSIRPANGSERRDPNVRHSVFIPNPNLVDSP